MNSVLQVQSNQPNNQLSDIQVSFMKFYPINENQDSMKTISKFKTLVIGSALFFQQSLIGQHSWGITAGINSAKQMIINDNYGFYGGIILKKDLPFHFSINTSVQFMQRVTGGGLEHYSGGGYADAGGSFIITAHEKLTITNKYYGFNFPILLHWDCPIWYLKPFIGAGMFYSYSLWGTSSMQFNDFVKNKSLSTSHTIEWNKPKDISWVKTEADRMLFESGSNVLNRNNYGFLIELGVKIKKIDISLIYAEGLFEHVNYYSSGQSYDIKLSLSYYFKVQTPKSQENAIQ